MRLSQRQLVLTALVATASFAAGCGGGAASEAGVSASAAAPAVTKRAQPPAAPALVGNTTVIPSELIADGTAPAADKSGVYIVQLRDDPAVTKRGKGRYSPNEHSIVQYRNQLEADHDAVLRRVGAGANKLYSYTHAFNGFAATLRASQAAALKSDPRVARIWNDERRELQTNFSPEFLGLDAVNGPWDNGVNGEDVIIGVIDSGIWPEVDSFSDAGDSPDNSYGPAPSQWAGTCQSGEKFSQQDCNDKLLGVRYFPYGFGASPLGNSRDGVNPLGYNSARDDDDVGHGTHTSSTAAGNRDVTMTLGGTEALGDSQGSGVAPRARIAHYKACWNTQGCFTSDLVASIDSAVADGVDVINYSIGSASTNIFAPDDVAFLFAAAAGVYVATSNGNSGPGAGTVGSPAGDPWVLSVGASTRTGIQSLLGMRVNAPGSVAGDYEAVEGAITKSLSVNGPLTGDLRAAEPLLACDPLSNDLTGHVALIERGACSFVAKVTNAVNAGATAIVMFTDARPKTAMGGTATSTTKQVPGVMIDRTPGLALAAELGAGETVNVTLDSGIRLASPIAGNVMAGFSSRGPNLGAIDVIKPDVTAPGVGILAGTTPTPLPAGVKENTGELFRYLSGTSMSSPHAAGALALIKQAHPDWSPAAAKSALMTSARQDVFKEDGATPADPFDMGGGHIRPGHALDPGLVYDAGLFDYAAYICAVNPNFWAPGTCEFLAGQGFDVSDPTQLNYPSIGVSSMIGSKTVQRTVTSVTPGTATYCATIEAPPGTTAAITAGADAGGCFEIAEGESHTYELTINATDTIMTNQWLFGALTWSHGPHNVRSPIAVRAFGIGAPAEVSGTGTDGSLQFDIKYGFEGPYTAGVHGLNPATEFAGNVADDPGNSYSFPGGPGIARLVWVHGPGTAYARWELRDEATDGNDDLDLYVWECDSATFACSQVGASTSPTSAEQVDVLLPKEGAPDLSSGTFYVIDIHGWQTDGPDANFTLFNWEFGLVDDAGNMAVTPSATAATLGATETLTVDWFGLTPGAKYLGAISHTSPGGLEGLTLISIE